MARRGAHRGTGNGQGELSQQSKSLPNGSSATSYEVLTGSPIPRVAPEPMAKLKEKPRTRVTGHEYAEKKFRYKALLVIQAAHEKETWAIDAMAQPARPSTSPIVTWVEHFGFDEHVKHPMQSYGRLLRRRFGLEG